MSDIEILAMFTLAGLFYLAVAAISFLLVKLALSKLKGKRIPTWIFAIYMVIAAILPFAVFRVQRLTTQRAQQTDVSRYIQDLSFEVYMPEPVPPGMRFDRASALLGGGIRPSILLSYRHRSGRGFVDLNLSPREGHFSIDPATGACVSGTYTNPVCRPIPTPKGRELYELSSGNGIALIGSTAIGLSYGSMPDDQLAAIVDSLVETDPDTIKFEGLD